MNPKVPTNCDALKSVSQSVSQLGYEVLEKEYPIIHNSPPGSWKLEAGSNPKLAFDCDGFRSLDAAMLQANSTVFC
jgi:hypothetical protein